MLKRLSIFAFLAALLIYSVGFSALALAEIGGAKASLADRLAASDSKNGLVELLFSPSDFEKTVGQRLEFWHGGQLFDLKKARIEGDSVRVFALADRLEARAIRRLAGLFQIEKSVFPFQSRGLPVLLAQLLSQPFLLEKAAGFPRFWLESTERTAFFFLKKPLAAHRFLFAPPPEA